MNVEKLFHDFSDQYCVIDSHKNQKACRLHTHNYDEIANLSKLVEMPQTTFRWTFKKSPGTSGENSGKLSALRQLFI